jgi:hypothetical protein
MTRVSKPIETVGSPSPITPFTKPAMRKVSVATMREKVWIEGIGPIVSEDRRLCELRRKLSATEVRKK